MEGRRQFLDLVPKEREWLVQEEKKLELRLGPPGGDAYLPNFVPWQQQQTRPHFLRQEGPIKESSQLEPLQSSEKKGPAPAPAPAQKRTAPTPMVGWPPVRSFRKNIASGASSKLASDTEKAPENCAKSLFVKINMDGIPIGRKVDLKSYDSYEKLSYAVDELFRGLLAAQSEESNEGRRKGMGCLVNDNGEYTLVYEDNEGDRMLVGDVPWHMFVSTVKRLRVLKTSELPTLFCGSKHGRVVQHE